LWSKAKRTEDKKKKKKARAPRGGPRGKGGGSTENNEEEKKDAIPMKYKKRRERGLDSGVTFRSKSASPEQQARIQKLSTSERQAWDCQSSEKEKTEKSLSVKKNQRDGEKEGITQAPGSRHP